MSPEFQIVGLAHPRYPTVDNCHVTVYTASMIKTFADKETQKVFVSGKSKRIPSDLLRRAIRRLEFIHFANDINEGAILNIDK